MSLLETVYGMFGGKRPAHDPESSAPGGPQCPQEFDILTYCEGNLSSQKRGNIELHLTDCDGCRELVSLYVQTSSDQNEQQSITPLSDESIKDQAARVITYIKQDEFALRDRQQRSRAASPVFGFSRMARLATAAVVVCAVTVAGVVLYINSRTSDGVGQQAIASAVEHGRRIEPRMSGNLPWSEHKVERGDEDDDEETSEVASSNLDFQLALSQLKHAQNQDAPSEDRHNLARLYLAMADKDKLEDARTILEQLINKGFDKAEVFNDLGVAYHLLKKYNEAIDAFSKALGKSDNFNEALFNKALAEYYAGDYSNAKRDWLRFIDVTKDQNWKNEANDYLKKIERAQRPAA